MNILNSRLPKIYKRKNQDCYLDPIRKKLIQITPEETIRQKVISYLIDELNVPEDMILVEEHLSHYGIDSKQRADIVILAATDKGDEIPLTVIECKAPEIPLADNVFYQAAKYSDDINSIYTVITNGFNTLSYKYDDKSNNYIQIETLPHYKEMLSGECIEKTRFNPPQRMAFEKHPSFLTEYFNSPEYDYGNAGISKDTPMKMALPIFNLSECIYDSDDKFPTGDYGMFRVIEDYGVRMLSYGNAAGGRFFGPYRSFLVDINGSTEFFSIGISTYWKTEWDDNKPTKTCICIAHDTEKSTHHALQFVVEDNLRVREEKVDFFHNGRIAIGRRGNGKISELCELVRSRCPEILKDDKFYLGRLHNDRMFHMNDPEIVELIKNFISYAIVRDEYRAIRSA